MATIVCAKSGITFSVEHFPFTFDGSTERGNIRLQHPVFNLDYTQLTSPSLIGRWVSRNFNPTDTKLYFLALLNSTKLVTWYCPATPSQATCESNITGLFDILDWLNTIKHPRLSMPHMAISENTADLSNVSCWIAAWNTARQEFESGYVAYTRDQLMCRKEDTLQRLLKTAQLELASYAGILADWAELAASYPEEDYNYLGELVVPKTYWKQLILTCTKSDAHIQTVQIHDLEELLDYLIDNLDAGTIYGHAVIKIVREGIAKHKNYYGFEFITDGNTGESVCNTTAVEDAFAKILASEAPTKLPLRQNYSSLTAYLKDKIRYDKAQQLLRKGE